MHKPVSRLLALLPWVLAACRTEPPTDKPPTPPTPAVDVAEATPTPPEPPRPRPVAPRVPPPVLPEGWASIAREAITVALGRDGTWLLAGDLGGHTAFWQRSTGVFKWADLSKAGRIRQVACANGADRCFSLGFDGAEFALRAYRLDPLESLATLAPDRRDARALVCDDAGKRAAALVTTGDAYGLVWFDVDGAAVLTEQPLSDAGTSHLAMSPDGSRVVRTLPTGGFAVHAADTGSDPFVVSDPELVFSAVTATPGNAGLNGFVAAIGPELVHVDLAPTLADPPGTPALRRVRLSDERFHIRAIHRLVDGRMVAATRPTSGGLVFWDAATGAPLSQLRTACPCEFHALSADGSTAACKCADRTEIRHGPAGIPAL